MNGIGKNGSEAGAARRAEVHEAADTLEKAVANLAGLITDLEKRLGCVMHEVPPAGPGPDKAAESTCALANRLYGLTDLVVGRAAHVRAIQDRLEV